MHTKLETRKANARALSFAWNAAAYFADPERVHMTTANGFVVVSRWTAAKWPEFAPSYDHYATLADAIEDYGRLERGVIPEHEAVAILPTRDGVPIGGPLSKEAIEIARRQA